MTSDARSKSIARLSKLWNFWMAVRWYLLVLLLFVGLLVFYKKEHIGTANLVIYIVLFILFLLVILIFNDNKGLVGNSVPFAVNPLPPHLGLDGVSSDVAASY